MHSLVRQAVPSSRPSWQSCLCATMPSCHNTFRHQYCARWGYVCVCVRAMKTQTDAAAGWQWACVCVCVCVSVCVGATAVALPLCGYPSPQWAALQPWIWSLQRLTSVGCHFREIDDRPGNGMEGGKDGWGRRRREGWRGWERRARGINGDRASLGLMVTGGSPFLDEPQKKRRKEESATDLKDCRGPKVWHYYRTKKIKYISCNHVYCIAGLNELCFTV